MQQFIKQRTRWNQGFLQILGRGHYWGLHHIGQRLLALYTLSSPVFQALTALYLPVSLYTAFFVKLPPLTAIILWLPAYMLIGQYLINWIGLQEFAQAHSIRLPRLSWLKMLLAFYGSTPAYRPVLDVEGWGELQPELNALSKTSDVAAMIDLVDDEMVGTLAVRGTPEECAAEIHRRFGDLADRVCCYFPGYDAALDDIAALAAALG